MGFFFPFLVTRVWSPHTLPEAVYKPEFRVNRRAALKLLKKKINEKLKRSTLRFGGVFSGGSIWSVLRASQSSTQRRNPHGCTIIFYHESLDGFDSI